MNIFVSGSGQKYLKNNILGVIWAVTNWQRAKEWGYRQIKVFCSKSYCKVARINKIHFKYFQGHGNIIIFGRLTYLICMRCGIIFLENQKTQEILFWVWHFIWQHSRAEIQIVTYIYTRMRSIREFKLSIKSNPPQKCIFPFLICFR